MPAVGAAAAAAKGAVLFHLLNLNLLMDLGAPPPDPSQLAYTESFVSDVDEVACHMLYGLKTCFSLRPPWYNTSRPVVKIPMAPEEIGTSFTLFTRANATFPATLNPGDLRTIVGAPFVPGKPFKVISHGYQSHGSVSWMKTITGELLRSEDQNVIVVDWSVGARPPYTQAVANIRLVGAQLAYLIYSLNRFADVPITDFHLIGHSLGAHLCGHAGTYLRDSYGLFLPRITGLDAAEPFFNDTHVITRLDPSDAAFVDVIHTDDSPILGFPLSVGMTHPIGDLDFFPNGGDDQPGCNRDVNCQHKRAILLFTESIRQSCPLVGVVCSSYQEFIDGECWGCENNNCETMGLGASPLAGQPTLTKLFLQTNNRSPFCGYHYRVSIEVSNSTEAREHDGEFAILHLQLTGNKDRSQSLQLSERSLYYEAGFIHRRVILTYDLGDLKAMSVTFEYPGSILNFMSWRMKKPTLYLKSVTVEPLGKDSKWRFCFSEARQHPSREYVLTKENIC
ncbi:hypothetical protein SK128_015663 [Halocaridina rubra]|uniref:PLAT domain-containing protein n=1 Tax=Halocaridina rubra TaxID=373956 RepID=A0AAN8WS60_HALRR